MSHFDLTDLQGNRYRLSAGSRLPVNDSIACHYAGADLLFSQMDNRQLWLARDHFYGPGQSQLLKWWRQERFGDSEPPLCPRQDLIGALCNHELIVVRLDNGEQQVEEEDNRAVLRVRIRQALAAIVAQERAEAARHTQMLARESRVNRALIYTGAFFNGLWNAGVDLAKWAKEVNDVINPTQRLLRSVHASHRALQRSRESGENVLAAYADEHLKGEKRELVQALGFDPTSITAEQLDQAMEVADLIWDDPALRADIARFAKDYVSAQHAIELTELSGSAAFEVLFTLVLAAVTAGAGLAVGAASQARHLAKFRKVGKLLMEFAEQAKKARQRLRRNSIKGNNGANRSFDEFPSEEVIDSKSLVDERSHSNRMQRSSDPQSGPPATNGPGSAAHKAQRWQEYQERGGSWDYERWSKTYDNNMVRATNAHKVVDDYHRQLGWGKREVTINDIGGTDLTRRLDIADVSARKGVEVKSGYITHDDAIRLEIQKDQLLIEDGWDIQWHFDGTASKPLLDALDEANIPWTFQNPSAIPPRR